MRPARSPSILATSLSTQTTSLPRSAKTAPVTSPTYPVPTTATFMPTASHRARRPGALLTWSCYRSPLGAARNEAPRSGVGARQAGLRTGGLLGVDPSTRQAQQGPQQHVGTPLERGPVGPLVWPVAPAALARDEDHPGIGDGRQHLRVMARAGGHAPR